MNVIATIGLGANLNDPAVQVEYALAELDRLPGTRLIARSGLYASAPVGYVDQPDFINAVAQVETALAPHAPPHRPDRPADRARVQRRRLVAAPRPRSFDQVAIAASCGAVHRGGPRPALSCAPCSA